MTIRGLFTNLSKVIGLGITALAFIIGLFVRMFLDVKLYHSVFRKIM